MNRPTIDDVRGWPATVDVVQAAAVFGIGRTNAYALARTGELPFRVLRVGARYVVPTSAVLDVLGAS